MHKWITLLKQANFECWQRRRVTKRKWQTVPDACTVPESFVSSSFQNCFVGILRNFSLHDRRVRDRLIGMQDRWQIRRKGSFKLTVCQNGNLATLHWTPWYALRGWLGVKNQWSILYWILASTGSQWSCFRRGVVRVLNLTLAKDHSGCTILNLL